jgi:hypothetical protein
MKFILNNPHAKQAAITHIQNLDLAARPIQTIEIKAFRKDRSGQQNKYYHGVVIKTISDYTGYHPSEVHALFKENLLPSKVVILGDKQVKITPSTTELSTLEMNAYIEQIAQFASESLGIFIPPPTEQF